VRSDDERSENVKRDVLLAGVGGQGLLSLAAVIGEAARSSGLDLKQAEVHGMAQRGGVVQSHVRYADGPIHSDLIREGTADLILALEPMEALRHLPFLSAGGALVTSSAPVENIPNYPDIEAVRAGIRALPQHRLIDASALAKKAGTLRCVNMVMLGAGSPFLELGEDVLVASIESVFSDKAAAVVEANVRAYRLGVEASDEGGAS
jgi:indolepyruvate ferredoxin oxidoreductase beta subunit